MVIENHIWCPTREVLRAIEGRWTVHIIGELLTGKKRHSELALSLTGINPKTLTARLRRLEKSGIVLRKMHEEIPPRVEYSLTPRGRQLSGVLQACQKLGSAWLKSSGMSLSSARLCNRCFKDNEANRRRGNLGPKKASSKTR